MDEGQQFANLDNQFAFVQHQLSDAWGQTNEEYKMP